MARARPLPLLTFGQARERLGDAVTDRTLRRYAAAGLIRSYKVGGRRVMLHADDVDALIRPIPAAGR